MGDDGARAFLVGYAISERCRKRVTEAFGWIKAQAGLQQKHDTEGPKPHSCNSLLDFAIPDSIIPIQATFVQGVRLGASEPSRDATRMEPSSGR